MIAIENAHWHCLKLSIPFDYTDSTFHRLAQPTLYLVLRGQVVYYRMDINPRITISEVPGLYLGTMFDSLAVLDWQGFTVLAIIRLIVFMIQSDDLLAQKAC